MRLPLARMMLVIGVLTAACSGGNFKGASGSGSTPDAVTAPPSPPGNTADLREKCEKAAEASFKTMEQTIVYPERKTCTFGTGANLERKDAFVQAQEVSPATLNLPAGDICSLNVDSPADAKLHYDDFLILSIDSRILFMSNSGLTSYLDAPQQGILTWDFKKVVGQPIKDFELGSYCLGKGADCVLPGHDKEGPVALHLTPAEIAPIASTLSGKTSVSMDLTATGDNDDTDCYHTALSVLVKIKYLP